MSHLIWTTTNIKIEDLIDYQFNPRSISKYDFDKLVKSLKEDGYRNRLLVDTDNIIIGGHSRKKALLQAGFNKEDTIEVLKPNRKLTDEEFKRINIRDNLSFGDWDFDILANHFDTKSILDWGFNPDLITLDDLTLDTPQTEEKQESKFPCKDCPHKDAA